jgi:NADPH2:quinone reductase
MSQMTAVEITAPGAPDVLQATTRPRPRAGHGQVVIALSYAGVNRPDALQRAGLYNPPAGASDLPGLEGRWAYCRSWLRRDRMGRWR